MVLFFVKHSSSSRNPKSVSQKVGGNHWIEPLKDRFAFDPSSGSDAATAWKKWDQKGWWARRIFACQTDQGVSKLYRGTKKNKFPKVHFTFSKPASSQTKNISDTSIPQVTLRFMTWFRSLVLRSAPLTSSSSSGSVWALGPADYIAEASSVHVKDEDVENNQCDIKIWFLNIEKTL